jgi:hypothetical protein
LNWKICIGFIGKNKYNHEQNVEKKEDSKWISKRSSKW